MALSDDVSESDARAIHIFLSNCCTKSVPLDFVTCGFLLSFLFLPQSYPFFPSFLLSSITTFPYHHILSSFLHSYTFLSFSSSSLYAYYFPPSFLHSFPSYLLSSIPTLSFPSYLLSSTPFLLIFFPTFVHFYFFLSSFLYSHTAKTTLTKTFVA